MSESTNNRKQVSATTLPDYIARMRTVAAGAVTDEDLRQMIGKMIELAKGGDKAAFRLVMDYALGGRMTPEVLVQQNLYVVGKATKAKPGTQEKVDVMRARASARLPLTREDDDGY